MCIIRDDSIQPTYENGVSVQYKVVEADDNGSPLTLVNALLYKPGTKVESGREKWVSAYPKKPNDIGIHTFHNLRDAKSCSYEINIRRPIGSVLLPRTKVIRVLCRERDHICSGVFSDDHTPNSVWERVEVPTDCDLLEPEEALACV